MRPGVPLAALAVAASVLAGCLGTTTDSPAPIDIQSPGTWTPLAPMPTARQEVAVAELNGRVFVIGGFGPGAEAVATAVSPRPLRHVRQCPGGVRRCEPL